MGRTKDAEARNKIQNAKLEDLVSSIQTNAVEPKRAVVQLNRQEEI